MLHRIKIRTTHDPLFALSWELYTSAFPEIERRDMEYHAQTMLLDEFHFEAILDKDQFIGILGWWSFDSLRFIEHLATDKSVRDRGYGKQILAELTAEDPRPIILEVEHPTEEMSVRRIGFYERSGFKLNQYDYSHPSYDVDSKEFVRLLLMTYPRAIDQAEYESFKELCYSKVHFGNKVAL